MPSLRLALFGALALVAAASTARADDAQSEEAWKDLKYNVFGEKFIEKDSPLVSLDAPTRAEDAALVPVDIAVNLPAGDPRRIAKLTLIIDENPSPVAATFGFGPDRREVSLSTRLRVNSYSFLRAVVETSDGQLHMAARFVKASGGCSAPALKDPEAALARLGEIRLKAAKAEPSEGAPQTPVAKAQVMIHHPNYSGLQMDQVTRLYVPAMFVDHITLKQGDDLVFEMEGGISLSEDPTIQISYVPNGQELVVAAEDTDGHKFSGAGHGF